MARHAKTGAKAQQGQKTKEPVFLVRPAVRGLGLDYLHVSLIALVIILIGLSLALSTFKQGAVLSNCAYGVINGTCFTPAHNASQALAAAERVLASYSSVNTSLSLLAYYSMVNRSKVSYLPSTDQWLVEVPYVDPLANNDIYNFTIMLHASNLTLSNPFIQTLRPYALGNDSTVALGTVSIYGKSLCTTAKPVPVYLMTDPYSPGVLNALNDAISASSRFNGSVSMSYYFLFSGYAANYYQSYGVPKTQAMGQYMWCASRQPQFAAFVSNLTPIYDGRPISNVTLREVALSAGINATAMDACIANASLTLDRQAQLADLYRITSTPQFIVNCKYSSLPQTLGHAINYSLEGVR